MSGQSGRHHGSPSEEALDWLGRYHGEVQVLPKVPIHDEEDFAVWYTPGVAEPCRAIAKDPDLAYEETGKGNRIAIVTDGSRILGLGDIGPLAGLPVMEGKAMLFKYLGGVDAIPICLNVHTPDEIVETVERLVPAFGGINLEDISQPKCFEILDRLRDRLDIPVWHDDQQGTATVALAGLINALAIVGKEIADARVALIGLGAANVATYRLLTTYGASAENILAVDSRGLLHTGREDVARRRDEFEDKWRIASETNRGRRSGGIEEALEGADVCIAFSRSAPDVIRPEWVKKMAPESIVFACANPIPEIYPEDAHAAGARIVGTGRSDFPNQVNNSLAFPGIFRGALDVRATTITDDMAIAGAVALASATHDLGLADDHILPKMTDWEVVPKVAAAVGVEAVKRGLARHELTEDQLHHNAYLRIAEARSATYALMEAGIIAEPDDVNPGD
jgi:malate dehydrogenase (oxaloacetate-decarboxylating)